MNKRTIIYFFIFLFIGISIITFLNSLAYKVGGTYGSSKTIRESMQRGVFIGELDYIIKPDSITLRKEKKIFIERGYKYGKYSAKEILPLTKLDKYKYQIVVTPKKGKLLNGNFYFGDEGDKWYFHSIPDTIKGNVTIRKSDEIINVGEFSLFLKDGRGSGDKPQVKKLSKKLSNEKK